MAARRRRTVAEPDPALGVHDPELRASLRAEARERAEAEASRRAQVARGGAAGWVGAAVGPVATEAVEADVGPAAGVVGPSREQAGALGPTRESAGADLWRRLQVADEGWGKGGVLPAMSDWWRGVLGEWLVSGVRGLVVRVGRRFPFAGAGRRAGASEHPDYQRPVRGRESPLACHWHGASSGLLAAA